MILGWPRSSFRFLCNTLWKKPNDIFGQPNTLENIDIANSIGRIEEQKRH